uniref:Androgen induced 1 n=2 Tax=Taeniopygia guttata TaxID=59729 RepID=A0A674HAX8_TAEGU
KPARSRVLQLTRAHTGVPPLPRDRPGLLRPGRDAELRLGSAPSPRRARPPARLPPPAPRRPCPAPPPPPPPHRAGPALRPGRAAGALGVPPARRAHTGTHRHTPGHTDTHTRGTGTRTRTRTQAHGGAPRAANMALVPCQVLRAAILLSYCSILCNYKAIDMPAHQTYGGSWKFLTFIDLGRP